MRKRRLAQLLAVFVLISSAGIAGAVPDEPGEKAVPMGGASVDQRVRERERMRQEYVKMKKKRAAELAKAREKAAGSRGTQVPGWRGPNGERSSDFEPAQPAAGPTEGIRRIEGSSKFFIYLAIVLLCMVLYMRIRARRAAAAA